MRDGLFAAFQLGDKLWRVHPEAVRSVVLARLDDATQLSGVTMVITNTMLGDLKCWLPPAAHYLFSTRAHAGEIYAMTRRNFPKANLQLVDASVDGDTVFFVLPHPNPQGIAVWIIQGTLPGRNGRVLVMGDYAGDLWGRGPVAQGFGGHPGAADGELGGDNLTYIDAGGGLAEMKWSANAQGILLPPRLITGLRSEAARAEATAC
jgi:hypothetical protein